MIKIWNNLLRFITFILIFTQISVFLYFIFADFKLINEFYEIDEQTLVNDKYVSNEKYIESNLMFKPDEIKNSKYNSQENIFQNCKYIQKLTCEYDVVESDGNSMIATLYNKDLNVTKFDTDISDIKTNQWEAYPLFAAQTKEKLREKMDFVYNNLYEHLTKLQSRFYWHETPFMLNAINELEIGRDKGEIFSQYGFLSIYASKAIMEALGGVNIVNFEKSKNIINLSYYLIAIIFAFLFFKSSYIRFIFIILLSINFFAITYHTYHFAPSVFDTRHFFDLVIVLMLFYLMKFNNLCFSVIALLLGLLSILIVSDFGLFFYLALIGTFIIKFVTEALEHKKIKKIEILVFIFFVIAGILAFMYYHFMQNPTIKYFMDGFYSLPINMWVYAALLFFIAINWLALVLFYDKLKELNYLLSYVFLLFYCEFWCVFFVWKGNFSNVNIAVVLLPFLIMFVIFADRLKFYLRIVIVMSLLGVYAYDVKQYVVGMQIYEKTMNTHKNYNWTHERAGGYITTYPFGKFQNALNLIDKYSGDNQEIYMISKYDNMLQFFSKKYSGLKYFELKTFIVTNNEMEEVVSLINSKADILYVDKTIESGYEEEYFQRRFFDVFYAQWFSSEVYRHMIQSNILKQLFSVIKYDYELIEHGELIDVYKRVGH